MAAGVKSFLNIGFLFVKFSSFNIFTMTFTDFENLSESSSIVEIRCYSICIFKCSGKLQSIAVAELAPENRLLLYRSPYISNFYTNLAIVPVLFIPVYS
jgi:hypothetical protein